jgi:hypothetical protein
LRFAANAYTTPGFGNVDLTEQWRNIAPIIGISGLFAFAWTTSALVNVVSAHSQLIERLEEVREREMQMRFSLRKEAWDARQSERSAERTERDKARAQAAGASLFQSLRVWRDERKSVKQLRQGKIAEIAELRRKEREGEEKLREAAALEDNSDSK